MAATALRHAGRVIGRRSRLHSCLAPALAMTALTFRAQQIDCHGGRIRYSAPDLYANVLHATDRYTARNGSRLRVSQFRFRWIAAELPYLYQSQPIFHSILPKHP